MFGLFKKSPPPDAPDITAVFELAGWCAAQALLNLSKAYGSKLAPGEAALLPTLVIQDASKKRAVTIFDSPGPETFQKVEALLDMFTPSNKYAVLSSDGYVNIEGRKLDSLNLNGNLLVRPRQSFCFAIPYEHPDGDRPFGFRRPIIVSHDGFDNNAVEAGPAFGRGRDSHPNAAAIWQMHFRPSE
jgi:hypothetical protein